MTHPPQLTREDRARVADRVGWPTNEPFDPATPFVDTANLVAALATPAERHDDHWIYTPAERVRILQTLLLTDGAPWLLRFGFLLAMSVVIATLGLANDQAAAVIAAMLIAPLMTPVLGIACATTLGLVRQALRLALIVTVSSIVAVGFGWMISATLVVHELTGEELSRTSPRLRDLVIALAAGAAGMYSVVRKDLSGVVPGVAIAVALVPPLATIGIVLELHEWSLARGAVLLYAMNVMAIVIAAIVVLLVTDFMQSPSAKDPKTLLSGATIAVATLAVVIPIWLDSRALDREAVFTRQAQTALAEWDASHVDHRVLMEHVEPGRITLVIAGPTSPPDLAGLEAAVATADFPTPALEIEWTPSSPVIID